MEQKQNPLLDEQWLQIASFWTTYRDRIRTGLIVVYLTIVGVIILYGAFLAFDMWVLSAKQHRDAIQSLTTFPDYTTRHAAIAPKSLPAPVAVVLPESASEGVYDVLLRFSNPNPQWLVDVTYQYEDKSNTVRILNGEERLVVVQGAATTLGTVPAISIVDTNWRRVRDVERLNALKPEIVTEDVVYLSSDGPSRVSFILRNNSIYNFWEATLLVALLQGDRAVAARQIQVSQLLSSEERAVTVNFFGGVGGVTDVLIVPFVDVSSEKVFMAVDAMQSLQ